VSQSNWGPLTLKNTEGTIQRNWQLGTQDEEKQKHNTIYVGHHYAQTDTNLRKIKDQ
jgi:hypothetical protein